MYSLSTSLIEVNGIGEKAFVNFSLKNVRTVRDLLLSLPLHYIDRSEIGQISDLTEKKEITFVAEVTSTANFYRRPRSIQSATVKDETGRIKLMWFNNKFILNKLKKGASFLFSGKLNKKGSLVHPQVEDITSDSIHTGRIVPVYSSTFGIPIGKIRRILKEIIDNLEVDKKSDLSQIIPSLEKLKNVLTYLHYPETQDQVIRARERLALEELLILIEKSNYIKSEWQNLKTEEKPNKLELSDKDLIPTSVPFTLTRAQLRSVKEIVTDIKTLVPMNRLLIGDVGSGKTVVAGIAAYHLINQGLSVALVAPTKILVSQHVQTLKSLFPQTPIYHLTVGSKLDLSLSGLYIGTQGLVNRFEKIKPSLIIYDEQHRFGVGHRSKSFDLEKKSHLLTMTATPIPRSLMLTIFSHLELSVIDEMPVGRKPTQTFLTSEKKRHDSYDWLLKLLQEKPNRQIIVVCPFIEPSSHESFAGVSNVMDKYKELTKYFKKKAKIEMLHGRMKKKEQEGVTERLFSGEIDILVTTPIVEVGVDLPTATVIVIENAERFGLASLHQLRGRVGRRGQQGYCLLFTKSKAAATKKRLKIFSEETSGMKLAEFDLQNRGAGDIFGMSQSGMDNLKFANWANIELISEARRIYNELNIQSGNKESTDKRKWESLLIKKEDYKDNLPLAN